MKEIVLNKLEERAIELVDEQELFIDLKEGSKLRLNILSLEAFKNAKITAELASNANLEVVFADYSAGQKVVESLVNLNGEGASCDWKLATLSKGTDNKVFDISFIHHVGHTFASMDNYGVAKDNSSIKFTGVNHIKEHASKSVTKQNAKIIVFDKNSIGVASPVLKIDENDVQASHGAIVGQLNNDHIFYLMSRGLSLDDARLLITKGYLEPISALFSDENKARIDEILKEAI